MKNEKNRYLVNWVGQSEFFFLNREMAYKFYCM